ncbi:Pre-mRNA-splicing factor cwc26 [Actinomortierella ambigua]|nr:Pre-mRNA-splicing factor cwc26 [Actinomortierella ambigua]
MSTQDYLKKYLSKPASLEEYKKKKLKKKKTPKAVVKKGNFAIHDEDDDGTWRSKQSDSDDDFPTVEEVKAAPTIYASKSSSWATVREGEKEAEPPKRNYLPEWDDVENAEERPAIAGVIVENEALAERPTKKKKIKRSGLTFKGDDYDVGDDDYRPTTSGSSSLPPRRSPTPPSSLARGASSRRNTYRSPSPMSRRRSPSPVTGTRKTGAPSRSPSPRQYRRSPSRSRSRSPDAAARMSSGAAVGLQTAEQLRRDTDRMMREQRDRMRSLDPTKSGRDAETVYRDAQGRKIDRVTEKIEAAAAARREIEKQEKMMEWGKGMVQREQEEERKKREEAEKLKPMARYKDDEELNEELKDRERWNDPAARFLTGSSKKSKKSSSAPKYPLYQGHFPPNRFNIRPGYRWDGVDRSNGFEKEYFNVSLKILGRH